jgi:hypothetical protein
MARRRGRSGGNNNPNQNRQIFLRVVTEMMSDGRVECDPKFNALAVVELDRLYEKAGRDDYDKSWEDDHKIAFFMYQVFDEILSQYERDIGFTPDADLDPAPGVPTLRDAPVREIIDIDTMPRANSTAIN